MEGKQTYAHAPSNLSRPIACWPGHPFSWFFVSHTMDSQKMPFYECYSVIRRHLPLPFFNFLLVLLICLKQFLDLLVPDPSHPFDVSQELLVRFLLPNCALCLVTALPPDNSFLTLWNPFPPDWRMNWQGTELYSLIRSRYEREILLHCHRHFARSKCPQKRHSAGNKPFQYGGWVWENFKCPP